MNFLKLFLINLKSISFFSNFLSNLNLKYFDSSYLRLYLKDMCKSQSGFYILNEESRIKIKNMQEIANWKILKI